MVRHQLWFEGRWQAGSAPSFDVHSPFNGEVVARVDYASSAQMESAIAAAAQAFRAYRKTSRMARSRLLETMRELIAKNRAELAETIAREAGKPIAIAEAEVTRALTTFTVAAEEARRFGGEVIPIDIDAGGRPYSPAVAYWVPRGPVLGITPFNFPLNLVAHKVAPALAAGCSILIKPAPQAPGGAVLLAKIFAEAAASVADARDVIPAATFQVLSCTNDVAAAAVRDPRLTTLTFTGSTKVGWLLQAQAIGKRVALELGGNAAMIVHSDADLARAATRAAAGGYGYAGQSCISVQRILVQQSVAPKFEQLLLAETRKTVAGDPMKRETVVGPLIDAKAADRVMAWIDEAKAGGARVLVGGRRAGNVIEPTVLSDAGRELRVVCEEVFGPVVVLKTYDKFEEALAAVNDSRFGLQAGVFTDSQTLIRQAVEELEVGGVMVNEVPTYRADQMPYGGVKESGLGREGLRYAMEEYSERRTVVHWRG